MSGGDSLFQLGADRHPPETVPPPQELFHDGMFDCAHNRGAFNATGEEDSTDSIASLQKHTNVVPGCHAMASLCA